MSSLNGSKTRTANRCRITLGGSVLAEGTSISVSENTNPRPMYTIGSIEKTEDVHTQLGVNWNISHLIWKDNANEILTLGNGLQNLETFDIEGLDESDNTTLFVVRTATAGNRDLRVQANQPLEGGLTGTAVRVEDGNGGGVGTQASASNTARSAGARNRLNSSLQRPSRPNRPTR